jgi:hypothetical protein
MKRSAQLLTFIGLILCFGLIGCERPSAKPVSNAPPANPIPQNPMPQNPVAQTGPGKDGAPAKAMLVLDRQSVDLVLDDKKSVEAIVKINKGFANMVEGAKDGVAAKIEKGTDGLVVKITVAKDANPGTRNLVVTGMSMKAPLVVNVKTAGKNDTKKNDDAKKSDDKKDETKKAKDAAK